MGYRVRVSDEIYKLLHIKACEQGVSVESLTEAYILDGIRGGASAAGSAGLGFCAAAPTIEATPTRPTQS